ncbi:hypothetical protein A2U01_0081042, partial [Trifolium medium]|nr:hypothetical protein [Trifolium medium]
LVSAPRSVLLTKYKHNVFPCSGRVRMGGDARNAFNF